MTKLEADLTGLAGKTDLKGMTPDVLQLIGFQYERIEELEEQIKWVWQWQFMPCRNKIPGHEYAIRSIHSNMGHCPLCKYNAEKTLNQIKEIVQTQ